MMWIAAHISDSKFIFYDFPSFACLGVHTKVYDKDHKGGREDEYQKSCRNVCLEYRHAPLL